MQRSWLVAAVLANLAPGVVLAQLRASERASVGQVVDGTRFVVEYSRPRARGRSALYGGLEPWGTTWTPGADTATTLAVSKAVSLQGRTIPAGRYSVWLVLREREDWTLVLDPRDQLYHTAHPDSTPTQIRMPVKRREVPHVEALTWVFSEVTTRSTTLTMSWGTVAVDLRLEVTPAYVLTSSAASTAGMEGTYEVTGAGATPATGPRRFAVYRERDYLFGRWDDQPPILLVPAGGDRFVQGWWRNGEVWAVYDEITFSFSRREGRVDALTVTQWDGDMVRARRLP